MTSEKKTDDLKTFVKLELTPLPHLILDIFILDKYELVFTPPPPTQIWTKANFLDKFCKNNFDISSLIFFLLLEDFPLISFSLLKIHIMTKLDNNYKGKFSKT